MTERVFNFPDIKELLAKGTIRKIERGARERIRKRYEACVIDPDALRIREDWNELNGKVVGGLSPGSAEGINFSDVPRKITLGTLKAIYSSEYLLDLGYTQAEIDSVEAIEPEWKRQGRDWSKLAHQIVGAEV